MATAEQLKSLLRSHAQGDEDRFYSTALQVAAREARQGHTKLAKDIKSIVEDSQKKQKSQPAQLRSISSSQNTKNELNGLLEMSHLQVRRGNLVLSDQVESRLFQVLNEQKQKDMLVKFDLSPRRKILLTGPPGTGKTMSAAMLATELKLPLYTIVLDNLITRYMGETASKLRSIFEHIKQTRAVYLFDEFDAIGANRGASNDVGEIRRILNSFLILVDQDCSESVIVAATNHPELLDQALYRRFDDIINFDKPEGELICQLIKNRLSMFSVDNFGWKELIRHASGLSAAEITRGCEDAAKETVLCGNKEIATEALVKAFDRRGAR